jgi:protoporphyrinogen oxidase
MQAIPDQLAKQLKKTEFRFNTTVASISENVIETSSGSLEYDRVIVTVPPHALLPEYKQKATAFQGTVNSYFAIPKVKKTGYIGLRPIGKRLINNLCVLSDVSLLYSSDKTSLLSVSTIGSPILIGEEFTQALIAELTAILGFEAADIKFLKHYNIKKALPILKSPQMRISEQEVKYNHKIYLAGDYLLGGSLNAAMISGRESVQIMLKGTDE